MSLKTMNWIQKIVIMLVTLILFNFTIPVVSNATTLGSLMLQPVKGLLLTIADAFLHIVEGSLIGFENVSWDWEEIEKKEMKTADNRDFDAGDIERPDIKVTPDEIFLNKIPSLNANFFRDIKSYDELQNEKNEDGSDKSEEEKERDSTEVNYTTPENQSSLQKLKALISNWYKALRYIAIIGLMCVLVYVGIRMVLSATAGDKAKYKKMLMDWVVALCLIFFMHYIMAFAMTLSERMVGFFAGDGPVEIELMQGDSFTAKPGDNKVHSLVEFVRVYTQLSNVAHAFTYLILYIVLVIYTCYFAFIYLKRFLYLAFLTLIAPLVALTYPLDKIGDGQAQAFNMWLKEYVYNALLQPFHALIYRIFVLMSMELAGQNLLYTCVVMGFMIPAEKFLKKMFGFDKASTASPLGAMATGAAMNKVMSNIKSKAGNSSSGGKGDSNNSSNEQVKFKAQKNDFGAFGSGSGGSGGSGGALPAGGDSGERTRQNQGVAQGVSQGGAQGGGPQADGDLRTDGSIVGSGSKYPPGINARTGELMPGYEYGSDGRPVKKNDIQPQLETGEDGKGNKEPDNNTKTGVYNTGPEPINSRRAALKNMMKKGAIDAGANIKAKGRTLWNNKGKAGRWIAKKGLGAFGAAALGTVGLAAGIATGDPSKVLAMTGLAMSAGYKVGGGVGDRLSNTAGSASTSLQQRYRDARYGVEGSDEIAAKKNFLNDKKNIEKYRKEFGIDKDNNRRRNDEEIREKMEEAWQYRRYGLTDDQTFDAMKYKEKLDKSLGGKSENAEEDARRVSQAAKVSELSSTITESELTDDKKLRARKNSLMQQLHGDEVAANNVLASMGDFHFMGNEKYNFGDYDPNSILTQNTDSTKNVDSTKNTDSTKNVDSTKSVNNTKNVNDVKKVKNNTDNTTKREEDKVNKEKRDIKTVNTNLADKLTEVSHNGEVDG